MARICRKKMQILLIVQEIIVQSLFFFNLVIALLQDERFGNRRRAERVVRYVMADRIPDQVSHMRRIVEYSDTSCVNNLRMNRNAFGRLCYLLEHVGGLIDSRHVNIPEKVCMFLSTLAHHKKNCIVKHDFIRSGHTVSKYFHAVLVALLKLYPLILVTPDPVQADSTDSRWKWFKGCLGALDGSYINVRVRDTEKPRYRNRKGEVSINLLGVVDRFCKFVYILLGWKGSAADARVLRDAINRPHGFKVSSGKYYLCDNGYTNYEGFLTPHRGKTESSSSHTSKGKEPMKTCDQSRRSWTRPEEEVLLTTLKEIVAAEWKSDNGFRTGYLRELEQAMIKTFPGTNLRAQSHINSKIHTWKKQYGSLFMMMDKSGVGWNETTRMIETTDEAWERVVRNDPSTRLMRYKSWPFYREWCDVFGKDRATGEGAEDIAEALGGLMNDENQEEDLMGEEANQQENAGETETTSVNENAAAVHKKKGLSLEYDISLKQGEVFKIVENLEGLNEDEKLIASQMLVKNSDDLMLFFSLPPERKIKYVRMKLDGRL
ncbi:hypothetical protein BUALT_Bualt13G0073500 [Buddleja alternifolia]|uniref:Transposase n=1 Tax=Buddleja alternifolia TaxID=168488 RepID=A0AAV6WL76_9LAMI|nr:hypothetical protein BUALT_Bualt13G0073500 [Buddleja alternifolia]